LTVVAHSAEDVAYVSSLLPEIDLITDGELRADVAAIWIECWHESSWERIEDAPKNPGLSRSDRPLYEHVRAVTQEAIAAADVVEARHGVVADRDTLLAAALLHDVSKLVEYRLDESGDAGSSPFGKLVQHAVYAAHKAIEKGLPDEIVHAIVSHTRRSRVPPRTLEALILHYVDYLDTDVLLLAAGQQLDLHKRW
jgi:putative nucleotidyltransferase with HDIG domain